VSTASVMSIGARFVEHYLRNRTCNFTTLALHVSLRSVLCLKCSETLCTSGFVDDVISAHAPHGGMCRCGCNELLRLAHANAHAAFYCLCRGLQSPESPAANHIIERQKHCRPLQTQFLAHFYNNYFNWHSVLRGSHEIAKPFVAYSAKTECAYLSVRNHGLV